MSLIPALAETLGEILSLPKEDMENALRIAIPAAVLRTHERQGDQGIAHITESLRRRLAEDSPYFDTQEIRLMPPAGLSEVVHLAREESGRALEALQAARDLYESALSTAAERLQRDGLDSRGARAKANQMPELIDLRNEERRLHSRVSALNRIADHCQDELLARSARRS